MSVRNVCNPNAATIDGSADILKAARLMREEHVGDLIVTEQRDGRTVPIGVLTDRDIVVEVVAKNCSPSDIKAQDTIRRGLLTVRDDNGIEFALAEMHRAGVRRVPVTDRDGTLVGVLAVDDVIEHLATQLGHIAGVISFQQQLEATRTP
jgi:predicted transcriptional regulator